ncbi:MAG: GNAT family N-acetyltransferase [Candidatus Binataceae bacterium]|nr:GNAT family N-acetyltransferase [Candidatus Binataceae bacterium]
MESAYRIRRHVFIEEQSVPEEIELDSDDAHALHVIAYANDRAVGTARMVSGGDYAKIGRMAVEREWRGCGVGRRLLDFLIGQARDRGYGRVVLNAQLQAEEFYLKAGFSPDGPPFEEAGIPHRFMRLELPPQTS